MGFDVDQFLSEWDLYGDLTNHYWRSQMSEQSTTDRQIAMNLALTVGLLCVFSLAMAVALRILAS